MDRFPLRPRLIVNLADDRDDADPFDGIPDVDSEQAGLQTSLRAALLEASKLNGPKRIRFEIPGEPRISIRKPLASVRQLVLNGTNSPSGGRVHLDGAQAGTNTYGLSAAEGSEIRHLIITSFPSGGLFLSGGEFDTNIVENCFIGCTPEGLPGGNQGAGIEIISGRLIRIGNTNAGARNVIGGNDGPAVLVKSRTSYPPPFTVVQGNWIGLHPNGLEALGNAIGIQALNETSGIVIGGVEPGAGNVISGNRGPGIGIEMSSRLLGVPINGNLIGLSADGKARVGNGGPGVQVVDNQEFIQIGDVQPESRNVISGNQVGVQLSGTNFSTVKIQNNFIGTDGAGTNALGNTQEGILCQSFQRATTNSAPAWWPVEESTWSRSVRLATAALEFKASAVTS